MGTFDFLDNIGDSKNKYDEVYVDNSIKPQIDLLEILQNRNLMLEDFKNEILSLFINKKINKELLYQNIRKSIDAHEKIKIKIISVDENEFKNKNDTLEYIGAIDRMPNDIFYTNNKERGKVSYNFAISLYEHLKGRILTIKEVCDLSDALDFKILKVYNIEVVP